MDENLNIVLIHGGFVDGSGGKVSTRPRQSDGSYDSDTSERG